MWVLEKSRKPRFDCERTVMRAFWERAIVVELGLGVLALLLGWLIWQEWPSWITLLGALVVVLAGGPLRGDATGVGLLCLAYFLSALVFVRTHRLIRDEAGHAALAAAMSFVNHAEVELSAR